MNQCDECVNFVYDEEYEEYCCVADMDEDDYARLISGMTRGCPFFVDGDEYKVVRHQM